MVVTCSTKKLSQSPMPSFDCWSYSWQASPIAPLTRWGQLNFGQRDFGQRGLDKVFSPFWLKMFRPYLSLHWDSGQDFFAKNLLFTFKEKIGYHNARLSFAKIFLMLIMPETLFYKCLWPKCTPEQKILSQLWNSLIFTTFIKS